jgi:hypothetical protein
MRWEELAEERELSESKFISNLPRLDDGRNEKLRSMLADGVHKLLYAYRPSAFRDTNVQLVVLYLRSTSSAQCASLIASVITMRNSKQR